jgi:hypothetical protein
MGLLDDAIREHLELKRRRGADAGEIAREEEEALGDPRAKPPETGLDSEAAEAPEFAEPEPDLDPEPELDAAEAEDLLPSEPLPEEAPVPYPAGDEPGREVPGTAVPREDPPWLEDDALEDRRRDPDPDPPTAEQEPAPRSPGQEDEDVLEDTPDFLQDTPEHDRLWFEQRPPRDFDFDS